MMPDISTLAILCGVGVLLQVADYATTRLGIERGAGREGNAMVARLMAWFGLRNGLILSKMVGVAVFILLYRYEAALAAGVLDLVYLVIVLNNHRIAQR